MKEIKGEDVHVGQIVADVADVLGIPQAFFKLVYKNDEKLSFEYVSGPTDLYLKDADGKYSFSINSTFYV